MARAQSPIKVHESTKEKVRYAALMSGLKQAELVERAVDEYVERHREDFGRRMERAREALLGGKASTLAYVTGTSEEDVTRVGGVASDQVGSRKLQAGDLEPGQLAQRPVSSRFPELGFGGFEDEPEEHVAQSLVDEAAV